MEQVTHDTDVKKEKWQKAIENRFNRIGLVLQKMILDCTADTIHDFRVEIKKLKALMGLFCFGKRETSKCRFPKSLNTVYKSLGSLREWQIQRQNIGKAADEIHYTRPLAYLNKIDRKSDLSKRRAMQLVQQLPNLKKNRNQIKNNCPEELTPVSVTGFIQKKMQAIQQVLKGGNFDDESMHDMRKKLKDVQYILSGTEKAGETKEHAARLESVQWVSGQLGDFHDLCIALMLLRKELKKPHKETDEKQILRKIRDNWYAEKIKLRRQTIQSTQALIQRHFPESRLN